MLSIYPQRGAVILGSKMKASVLSNYVKNNKDLLRRGDHYLGGWMDKGKAYLDVSVRVAKRQLADRLARRYNQLAYFDLRGKKTVYVRH